MTQWIGNLDDMPASVQCRRDNPHEGLLRQQGLDAVIRYDLDPRHQRSQSRIADRFIVKRSNLDRAVHKGPGEYVRQAVIRRLTCLRVPFLGLAADLKPGELRSKNLDLFELVNPGFFTQLQGRPNRGLAIGFDGPVFQLNSGYQIGAAAIW